MWGARANLVNSLILYLREISTNAKRTTKRLHPRPVEGGDESLDGAVLFLDESIFDAAVEEVLFRLIVLFVRQAPIDLWIVPSPPSGHVLTH